jgi:hypothetical protein
MRQEVIELRKLGPLPPSDRAVRENLQELFDKYHRLIMSVRKPVTDEEARVLITIFGSDDGFGLVWPLVHLIESASGWPLADCLRDTNNEWIQMLRQRLKNSGCQ